MGGSGRAPVNLIVRALEMEPPSAAEKRLRFAFGLGLGFVIGASIALRYFRFEGPYTVTSLVVAPLLCGILAMRFGDRFWYAVGDFARGLWWR